MSANSTIEWTATVQPDGTVTPGKTWNPVRGCSVISPGCTNCYAMKQAHRFSGSGKPYEGLTKQTKAGPQWTGEVRGIISDLYEPLRWQKPQRIFVNSMSDLFHERVDQEFIAQVFAVMAFARWHTFQILTKRADRMREVLSDPAFRDEVDVWVSMMLEEDPDDPSDASGGELPKALRFDPLARRSDDARATAPDIQDDDNWPLPNVWLGVSVENQKYADERIPLLLRTPAAIRFISAEPLLGPVQLHIPTRVYGDARPDGSFGCDHCCNGDRCDDSSHRERRHCPYCRGTGAARKLNWVIVGGESGNGARPCHTDWIANIVQQCGRASVPCFVKQLGSNGYQLPGGFPLRDRKGGDITEWPEDLRVRQFPEPSSTSGQRR